MEAKIIWLAVFVALLWAWCIFWGIKGAIGARTASAYFIAGRRLSPWLFVLATTAGSFTGWAFIGHPGLILRDGFPYAYVSLCAIAIPLTGLIFLKRQWIIGRRFGFVTPGEMLSYYFRSDAIRLLVILVAVAFAVPFLAVQLRAAGFLLNVLTDGRLGVDVGMWLLAAVLLVYVAAGGLRAVAHVDSLQCVLLAAGIVILGALALYALGGWDALQQDIARFAGADGRYAAVPGVIRPVADGEAAEGGAWTGVMILTFMFALMGLQATPMFSMWAFASRDPAPFAPQQVWASSLGIGIALLLFAAIQGTGAHFLGADAGDQTAQATLASSAEPGATPAPGAPLDQRGGQDALVPQLIGMVADAAPWLGALLAVCALAAIQSTGAAASSAGGLLSRDLVRRFLLPSAGQGAQMLLGRIGIAVTLLLALAVAMRSTDALVLLAGLAFAYGLQMWPALIAVCYCPWLTRSGIVLGLVAGVVAVTLTEPVGLDWFDVTAWGRWPLTIHSAGWGIVCNLAVAVIVSTFTRDDMDRKMEFHNLLAQHAALPPARRKLVPLAWIVALVWLVFAVGPGVVIGNRVFGSPDDAASWLLGIPSIWAWQLLWWALGVLMMWFLAYGMQMATVPETEVEPLADDIEEFRARI